MDNNNTVKALGELQLIKIIEELIFEKTGKIIVRDDSFFLDIDKSEENQKLVLNSDMLVSTTDIPKQASYYQIGCKSVIMNLSDLIVKGVKPKGIVISLGLPNDLGVADFKELISGIIDSSVKFKVDYIGGDINETKELIINPTVIGRQHQAEIIYRKGMKPDDLLVITQRFGSTGVGFDILIKKSGTIEEYPDYKRSILSVLEPTLSEDAYIIGKCRLATSSIDSSDGLVKSLSDLMLSNPNLGFNVEFNKHLVDEEAINYNKEFNIPLEELVLYAGEEFIHLFTIDPENLSTVQDLLHIEGKQIFIIGKVIREEKIFLLKDGEEIELKSQGYEHFK